MRAFSSSVACVTLVSWAIPLVGCGGGGGGGGGAPSLFVAGVTAQDLVAASVRDTATTLLPSVMVGDIEGRGQATLPIPGFVENTIVDDIRWSPDHSLLAVLARLESQVGDDESLFVVEPLTGATVQIGGATVTGNGIGQFEWSPDGAQLAFQRANFAAGSPLFVVDRDGANVVEVSGALVAGGHVNGFLWSPDSSKIAINMDADSDNTVEVYVVPRDGSFRVKVSGAAAAFSSASSLQWSPDSARIAFTGNLDGGSQSELFVSLASGSGGRTQLHPALVGSTGVNGFLWAPDGSRIAYMADQLANAVFELYTVRPDGTGNVRVSGPMAAGGDIFALNQGGVLWAPDSSRIAYAADETTNDVIELFTVVPDGSLPALRVSGPMVTGGDIGGSFFGINQLDFVWSPDSTRLAYFADQDVDETRELYVTPAAFASSVRLSASVVGASSFCNRITWSSDSLRLVYGARHLSTETDTFVSELLASPPVVVVPAGAGVPTIFGGQNPFSLAGDRVVLSFKSDVADDDEVRSYSATTLAELTVLNPPTPSQMSRVTIR